MLEPLGASVGTARCSRADRRLLGAVDGVPVLGFPGNPVSTQVSFVVFLRRLLREAAGLPAVARGTLPAHRGGDLARGACGSSCAGVDVRTDRVEPIAGPGSHLVAAMAAADVLIDIPDDVMALDAGDDVRTWAL